MLDGLSIPNLTALANHELFTPRPRCLKGVPMKLASSAWFGASMEALDVLPEAVHSSAEGDPHREVETRNFARACHYSLCDPGALAYNVQTQPFDSL